MGWLWGSSSSPSDSSTTSPSPSLTATTTSPSSSSPPSTTTTTPSSPSNPADDPLFEASLPSTMSCRQAFDNAFYCQSLGGKFNDVYRYGGLRSCSDHWAAFWFCMRLPRNDEPTRQRAVREFYREKEAKRYRGEGGRGSEDVWEGRREIVGRAWDLDPNAPVKDSA